MNFGICPLSLAGLRKENSHRSELVSQLLFGETYEVLTGEKDWLKVKCSFDQYEGWLPASQHHPISPTEHQELQKSKSVFSYDLVQILLNGNSILSILLGSRLPWYLNQSCRIGSTQYSIEGNTKSPESPISGKEILENAYMYLHAPYLWGGRSPFGIDCSGLSQMAFRLAGFTLKRDAWMQAEQGQTVHLLDESRPGDLAFFDNEEGKIIHVGILVSRNRIIHASGSVRVDPLDHHGIFNTELKKYTHKLRLIRRLI